MAAENDPPSLDVRPPTDCPGCRELTAAVGAYARLVVDAGAARARAEHERDRLRAEADALRVRVARLTSLVEDLAASEPVHARFAGSLGGMGRCALCCHQGPSDDDGGYAVVHDPACPWLRAAREVAGG